MEKTLFTILNNTSRTPWGDAVAPLFAAPAFLTLPLALALCAMLAFGPRRRRAAALSWILVLALGGWAASSLFPERTPPPWLAGAQPEVYVQQLHTWLPADLSGAGYGPELPLDTVSRHGYLPIFCLMLLAPWGLTLSLAALPFALAAGIAGVYAGLALPGAVALGWLYGIALCICAFLLERLLERLSAIPESSLTLPPPRKLFACIFAAWVFWIYAANLAAPFGLIHDEAYYLEFSRHLDWGYYSKPPLVAYLAAIFRALGGDTLWSIRTPSFIAVFSIPLLSYALGVRLGKNEHAGFCAGIAMIAAVASRVSGMILTTVPLSIPLYLAAILLYSHAVVSNRKRWWTLLGITIGTGILTRYTNAVLIPGLMLHLIVYHRSRLRGPGPILALSAAACAIFPYMLWQAQHGWISFLHTAGIGDKGIEGFRARLQFFGVYFSGLLVYLTVFAPAAACAAALSLWRSPKSSAMGLIALTSLPLLLFYFAVSFFRMVNAYWTAQALAVLVLAAGILWAEKPRRRAMRAACAAILIASCGIGVVRFAQQRPNTMGREIALAFLEESRGLNRNDVFLLTEHYGFSALLSFYLPTHPFVYCGNVLRARMSQYDIWGGWEELESKDALYLNWGGNADAQFCIDRYKQHGLIESGETRRTFSVDDPYKPKTDTLAIIYLHRFAGKMPDAFSRL